MTDEGSTKSWTCRTGLHVLPAKRVVSDSRESQRVKGGGGVERG